MTASYIAIIGNTAIVELNGLFNKQDEAYVNDATVSLVLENEQGQAVSGVSWPAILTYVAGSNGDYSGIISHNAALVNGETYNAVVTATLVNGMQGVWTRQISAIASRMPTVRYMPTLLSTNTDQITIFRERDNALEVTLAHDGEPLDLTWVDRFELHGLTDEPIDSAIDSKAIRADHQGTVLIDIGSLVTKAGLRDTTLIAYGSYYTDGIVLWDKSLPRSRVSALVAETSNQDDVADLPLDYGLRIQLMSRTNNVPLANAIGFTVNLVDKGVQLTDLTTDAEGYMIIQHTSLDTLGEEVSISIASNDGAISGFTKETVEDVSTYLL